MSPESKATSAVKVIERMTQEDKQAPGTGSSCQSSSPTRVQWSFRNLLLNNIAWMDIILRKYNGAIEKCHVLHSAANAWHMQASSVSFRMMCQAWTTSAQSLAPILINSTAPKWDLYSWQCTKYDRDIADLGAWQWRRLLHRIIREKRRIVP